VRPTLFTAALLLLTVPAHADRPSVQHAYQLIEEQRIEEARAEVDALVKAHGHDPEVAFVDGDLAFELGQYERAEQRLTEAAGKLRGQLGDEAKQLRDLVHATFDATRGFAESRGTHFVIRHAPGKDALLVPYALDALERAYEALGHDFGWSPSEPVRVEIYPEVADLAKVSTLTLKEIETSGTIALCKFNRVMITSPRALLAGYPWLDTLTHEYTHFVIARVSHNTVPIWLHEGLAKYEERRWREAGSALSPTMEHLLATGIAHKHLITFEQMHPSMAKLPSQEDTALAFAEVHTVIEYLHDHVGWPGIQKIVARLRAGASDGQAVAAVTERSFEQFQRDWRAWLHGRKLRTHPGIIPAESELRFKKGAGQPTEASEDDSAHIGEERARRFARLGGMLRARHRLAAAAAEYEKAQAIVGPGHPSVANKLARTYLELGEAKRAIVTAEPALELYPDQAAPNATLGEAWLAEGNLDKAARYLESSIQISPFDPAVHCALENVYRQRGDRRVNQEASACAVLQGK
jgi:tetratricopeptide (TPR) repeat protein